MLKISKDKIPQLLTAWAEGASVYVPQEVDGISTFRVWQGTGESKLGQGNAVVPPKDLFFPRTEEMYRYQVQGPSADLQELPMPEGQQVVVGLRSCDARSLRLMDEVFLTKGYVDEFYRQRRENTLTVALACREAQDTCFCTSFGIDPGKAEGVDVQAWEVEDGFLLEAVTEKGRGLLEKARNLLVEVPDEPPPAARPALAVDVEGVTEKLQSMFEHPFWAELCRKCLGCGLCTYLCPTCHCFDIQSENRGDQGFKFRCWDSCMFSEYTRMAGGHNPRPSKKERVRNRFLHKLQYFPERYGLLACVGCGRCLEFCPVHMDITRIIRAIKEVALDE
ncbi:MAG: 4Fe-4S dicluster domain-containing protein [Moorellaceae bacterium]